MRTFFLVLHVMLTLGLIGVILLQRTEASSAFSSTSFNGPRRGGNFLTKLTAILAISFIANNIILALLVKKEVKNSTLSVLSDTSVKK